MYELCTIYAQATFSGQTSRKRASTDKLWLSKLLPNKTGCTADMTLPPSYTLNVLRTHKTKHETSQATRQARMSLTLATGVLPPTALPPGLLLPNVPGGPGGFDLRRYNTTQG